ncbi:hypothetical protein [Amycolatopsis thermoflava]|uniref:hypothetical protein n=1 Tax=Amycolatopsis thermoflava TaxID=84480 RepID=UPI003F4A3A5B
MTGPEHYSEAEGFIRNAQSAGAANPDEERVHLAYAQVHATLALAAATAMSNRQNPDGPPGMTLEDQAGWDAVARDVAW